MTNNKKGSLGKGLAALIPQNQNNTEKPNNSQRQDPTDILFGKADQMHRNNEIARENLEHQTSEKAIDLENAHFAAGIGYFANIPLDKIIPNQVNPREYFEEEDLQILADSIREVGVLQPIIVRKSQDKFEIIMGERRFRASKLAGETEVPAIVRQTENQDMLRDALLENIHRVDLNVLEEAAAYQQLMSEFGLTQEELSAKIQVSRPKISNTLRILNLPPSVQKKIAADVINSGQAKVLLSLEDKTRIEELANRIVNENISVRKLEELVYLSNKGDAKIPKAKNKNIENKLELVGFQDEIVDALDTIVEIKPSKKGGKIIISFANVDDLGRITDIISGEK